MAIYLFFKIIAIFCTIAVNNRIMAMAAKTKKRMTKLFSHPLFIYTLIIYYSTMLGSSRPRCFFLSTPLRMMPMIRAAMPKQASMTRGHV